MAIILSARTFQEATNALVFRGSLATVQTVSKVSVLTRVSVECTKNVSVQQALSARARVVLIEIRTETALI